MGCGLDADGGARRPPHSHMQMCSACRGDYEDPDAVVEGEEEDEPDAELPVPSDPLEGSHRAGEGARKGEARRIGRCGETVEYVG